MTDKTDTQIEAVARAICAADAHDWDRLSQYPYHALEQQHMYKRLAKAAIAALREHQETVANRGPEE